MTRLFYLRPRIHKRFSYDTPVILNVRPIVCLRGPKELDEFIPKSMTLQREYNSTNIINLFMHLGETSQSKMKYAKDVYRNRFIDSNLDNLLKITKNLMCLK